MNRSLRPYRCIASCLSLLAGFALVVAMPAPARAQAQQFTPLFAGSNAQAATIAQGYLGIDIADVDADKAQALRLKDTRGAVITLIDHDAPAGQIGLKVNDVVLQLNGQPVETADQFRRQLKEMPPGRKVTLEISRDGSLQSITVELADRKLMEKNVWSKLGNTSSVPEMGILAGDTPPSGFHMPFGSTLKVGALVEPLTSQMAAYLGVDSGLMVKQVARKSEAEAAGFRAFDVILKVGTDSIATSADWDRALLSNQGKPVQVTILRDKKQQTLTLQVDSKHRQGMLGQDGLFSPVDQQELAEIDHNMTRLGAEIDRQVAGLAAAQAQVQAKAEAEAQALRDRTDAMHFGMSPEAARQLRQQTEKLREAMKDFEPNPRQMEQLRRQTDELRKSFNPDQFKVDPRQMQEFRRRMDRLRREMEEWSARAEGRLV